MSKSENKVSKSENKVSKSENKRFTVVTDRKPFWDGKPCPLNSTIEASPDDPAIVAMLARKWIVES